MRHALPLRRPLAAALVLILPSVASADGWTVAGGGNFQYDWARFDADVAPLVDDFDVRRARLSVTAKLDKSIELKAEYDLKPNAWTDVFARWSFAPGHAVRVGQFKQPQYLDELTADKVTLFMEQASPSAFSLARRLGGEYAWTADTWSLTGTVFGQNLQGLNDGTGVAVRGTWLPLRSEDGFLHLAASASRENPDSDSARFSTRPEAALSTRRFADTGTLAGVDSIGRYGVEALWVHGPWLLQGEALRGHFARDAGDFDGNGWYVQTSWLPFGQQRGYKNGALDAPKVAFGDTAIELGARYSRIDLDDGSVRGGRQSNWTLGATWWVSSDIRLLANYIRVDSQRRGVEDDPRILEFRAQLAF
jgi:phosphate-selective porin OprO/OprP